MDPATGRPAKNGLISATAVGDSGIRCDALSTALFVMGPEKAAEFWRAHRDFEMVLVTEDHEILVSAGIAEDFEPENGIPYSVSVIK
jgi:thiamine biosynthesis lipoprotein